MAKYIPKSALVAEIDDWRHNIMMGVATLHGHQRADATFEYEILGLVRDFIDTIEVKEVDLEKEFESFLDNIEGVPRMWHSDEQIEWAKDIAKHFFELGTLSTITEEDCKLIWNIGDDLPYMQEEDFFKELLRRYKAQKGK